MATTLLQLAPPTDQNRIAPKIITASVIMVIVGIAVFLLNPHRTAQVSIDKVQTFSPHTEFAATQGRENKVIGEQASTEDDLYAVTTFSVANKLRLPIFLDSTSATMTTADGSTLQATVVSPQDLSRLETMFPQLKPMVTGAPPAVSPDAAIAPGATATDTIVLLFPQVTSKDWQAKKDATLTINLAHGAAPLIVPIH
jgi:hypothetical protein